MGAQCPGSPGCTFNQWSFPGNLFSGQTLCITTGTYTGNVNTFQNGATIYVAPGATFAPSNLNNPQGRIINCGTVNLNNGLNVASGFRIDNYGSFSVSSSMNFNGTATFNNDFGATMNFNVTHVNIDQNSTFVNDGTISANQQINIQNGSSFTNNYILETQNGNLDINGTLNNYGLTIVRGTMDIRSSASVYNYCTFLVDNQLNNFSWNTRNDGYVFTTGDNGGAGHFINHQRWNQGADGVTTGVFFSNNNTIIGGGDYIFSGTPGYPGTPPARTEYADTCSPYFVDTDGDGALDGSDLDDDNDGILDTEEGSGDTDGDGIPNELDLDSDNDGIYDAVEAGHGQGHVNGRLPGAVGADGVPNSVQNSWQYDSGIVNYTVRDSDFDGTDDYRELDSDNDGCDDVEEAGYTDSNGDGRVGPNPITVNDDGVVTSGGGGYTAPNNLNGNGTFDFQEAGNAPTITGHPGNSTICPSGNTTFTVASTGDTFQWQYRNGGAWNNLSDGGVYSDTDTNTLVITGAATGINGYQYRVIVTNSGFTCTDATSNAATLTVADTQAPVITGPGNINTNNTPGACSALVNYTFPTATDNCSAVSVVRTGGLASGSNFPVGTTTNTFTSTDPSGNVGTFSFTVTVTENEAPVVTGPGNINVNTAAGTCTAVVNYTFPTATDNCSAGGVVQIAGLGSGSTFPLGTTTNTFRSTDPSGNVGTYSFDVTVTDNQDPVITGPGNINQNNDAGVCTAVVNYTFPTATDNCATVSVVQTGGLASGSTFPLGTTTNTFTSTDPAGNVDTYSFDVVVSDTEAPVISGSGNINVNNDAGVCTAVVNFAFPTATDNCSAVSVVQTGGLASGSTYPFGTTTNTFTSTDAAGNVGNFSFDVTVSDGEAPVISGPSNINANNAAGVCSAVVNYTFPTATDNCSAVSVVQTGGVGPGGTFPVGTTTNTFTSTDGAGNVGNFSFDVIVADTEAPVVTGPANISVNNDPGVCTAVVNYTLPSAMDNCEAGAIVQTAGLSSGSTFPSGTTTNTFTSTDAAGNVGTYSFDILVVENEAPVITGPSDINVNNDSGACNAVVNYTFPTATDNCAAVTVVQTAGLGPGSTFPIGTTTNTFTSTDPAGNVDTHSFDVTVTDNQLPVVTGPGNMNLGTDAGACTRVINYTILANDNCSAGTVVQTAGLVSGSAFPVGTTTNTFTSTDPSGNVGTYSFDVTISDNEDPVITGPSNRNVSTDAGVCNAVVNYTFPTATDNCNPVTVVQTGGLSSGSTYPLGTTTNTFTSTDLSGNVGTFSFDVVVSDNELPVVTGPADISVNNDPGLCTAVVNYILPMATDNCSAGAIVQTAGLASGSTFPSGTTTNTFTSTDPSGNVGTYSFDVTVMETELPVITGPSNISVNNDAGLCTAVVNYTTPTATDNCAAVTVVQTAGLPSGGAFPVGTTTNTFTSTDPSGNVGTYSFDVTVTDVDAPVITGPGNMNVGNDPGVCTAVVNYTLPTTDNCAAGPIVQTAGLASGSTFPLGTTTNTFTSTDAAGNVGSYSFDITVSDTQGPTISGPSDMNVNNDAGVCNAVVNFTFPTAIDNCSGGTTVVQTGGLTSGSTYPLGTTTNTYTATDSDGNVGNFSFDVTVVDAEAPTASNPATVNVNCLAQVPAVDTAVVTDEADNCTGSPTVSFVSQSTVGSNPEVISRIYRVTDGAGNTTDVTQTINVYSVAITAQPADGTIVINSSGTFTVTVANADTFQWQVSTDSGTTFTNVSDGAEYTGAQTATLTLLNVPQSKDGYLYRVVMSNSAAPICGSVLSNSALLSVTVIRHVISNRRITYRVNN